MEKVAVLFAGQGAQKVGMGRSLYDHVPESRQVLDEAEAVIPGILDLCFEGPQERLNETVNTQPCVLAADVAAWAAFGTLGIRPWAGAGFSLGEYAALVAAGVLKFDAALRIVQKRAQWMQEAAERHPGGMAAVLGLSPEKVRDMVALIRSQGVLEAVNFNCPGQIVVAGDVDELESLLAYAKENRIKCRRLPVSGAFHSQRMHEAADKVAAELDAAELGVPEFTLYANKTARPYTEGEIRATLSAQTESPVLFEQIARDLLAEGAETFVELGPGVTLSGFIKRLDKSASIMHVDGYDSFLEARDLLVG